MPALTYASRSASICALTAHPCAALSIAMPTSCIVARADVVAALAVAGLVGQEGLVIRRTFLVFMYYVSAAGILGLIVCRGGI